MAGMKALVALSFSGAIGLTFLMLPCVLGNYGVYWAMFVLLFYFISLIPYFTPKRITGDSDASSNACSELAAFFTTGIIVSVFGFAIVLAQAGLIMWGACCLVLAGNTVIFGFFLVFDKGDEFNWE